MDDESEQPESNYPLAGSTARMSKTPSWVMLGFGLGALFVYAMMRHGEPRSPSTVSVRFVDAPKTVGPREAASLTTIEAVFAVWGEHATWSGDTTEVALWNKQERKFSDCYEVRRIAGNCFFRSIPELTRRIIRHGRELPDSPLQFTETEEQYREWLDHDRKERPIEREVLPPQRPAPTAPTEAVRARPILPVDRSVVTPPPLPPPNSGPVPGEKK
jgi:hypothetical protein